MLANATIDSIYSRGCIYSNLYSCIYVQQSQFNHSPTHGSDGLDSSTLPVPAMQGHTLTTPPVEELIAGQG